MVALVPLWLIVNILHKWQLRGRDLKLVLPCHTTWQPCRISDTNNKSQNNAIQYYLQVFYHAKAT